MRGCFVAALLVLVVVAGSRSPVLAQQALLSDMERRAEQGDAESQFILGSMYADGTVVDQDGVVAAQWFRREYRGSCGCWWMSTDRVRAVPQV